MALYYDLQIYKDVHSLVLLVFQYTKEFPKEYKFNLGEDMRRDSIVLVRSIYRVNKALEKNPEFDVFMDDFEVLKFELRLSMDLHLISIRKYAEISRLVDFHRPSDQRLEEVLPLGRSLICQGGWEWAVAWLKAVRRSLERGESLGYGTLRIQQHSLRHWARLPTTTTGRVPRTMQTTHGNRTSPVAIRTTTIATTNIVCVHGFRPSRAE